MVHQWGFFGSISAIRKIWSLTANSRSLQAAALKSIKTTNENYPEIDSDIESHGLSWECCLRKILLMKDFINRTGNYSSA